MLDPIATYEALCGLRAADDLVAPENERWWVEVDRALRGLASRSAIGGSADRDDARQTAFLRAHRGVRDMKAETPAAAVAWLRSIYQNVLRDIAREQQRRRAHASFGPGDERPIVDDLPSPPPVDPRLHDPSTLEPLETALFEAVERFVAATARPLHRANALRNAQLAYRRYVKEESMEALEADVGAANRDVLYQWLRRGRVQVLVPGTEAWRSTLAPDVVEHEYASGLLVLLREADRADAGRPRPERRKNDRGAVSRAEHWKSAQCDPSEGDDD